MSGFFNSVEEFVTFSRGDHAIQKVLIANNGIGATKAIRSIRRWSFETFGNERMIKFVVMATPEDMRANAEYIRMADQVVDVPGGSNNNNYANINLICQIAERLKVDAVMPMWGHASENPLLPTTLLKLGHRVSFIGPPAEPMQALGDKIGSTIIAQSAGVPTIKWNGDDLRVNYQEEGIPQEVYDGANVTTAEDALACAERIGYPVMIKASEGGGGKGIRKVLRSEDVFNLYRQVQGEIPGSPIFVMKMASHARHLEVQLLADKHGDAIALSGRDCSVQRRHQKIIEEGPPIAAPVDVFRRMENAAVALAKTVGYCNAGTVEYLYMDETQEFAFLELNPRLQVEHPVTENILGLNLPACQLQVAMGIPLHRIADVRKLYGRHPRGIDTIDFAYAERVAYPRHCIAVRVTAENPEAAFQPTSGLIKELHFHSSVDVWGYFSVNNSGLIHEFADSQFGHIFAAGKDRESARRAMVVALKELQIRGDIRTTIEYIIKLMQSEDFVANRINTDWLDGRIARHKELSSIENLKYCPSATLVATCGAALQGYKHFIQRDNDFITLLKMGQVPTKDTLSPSTNIDLIFNGVKYKTVCHQCGSEKVNVVCNGKSQSIGIRTLADGGYLLNVSGKSHVVYSKEESGGSLRMIFDGNTCMFTPEYDPTKLASSVAGKLARILVDEGAHVNAGDPFVEIEVMKMYMTLKVLESGTVHFQMSEGATLMPGDVIAVCKLDNPDSVVRAEEFRGSLLDEEDIPMAPIASPKQVRSRAPQIRLRESLQDIEKVLAGFPLSDNNADQIVDTYIDSLKDPLLPALKVEESLSVLRGRIDVELFATISSANNTYRQTLHQLPKYPATKVLLALQAFCQTLPIEKRAAFNALTSELWSTVEPFLFSIEEIVLSSLVKFLETYLTVEKQFDGMSFTDVVTQLRKDNVGHLDKVLQLCRSHVNIKTKNVLILQVIEAIKLYPSYGTLKRPTLPAGLVIRNEIHTRKIKVKLTELSKLRQPVYSHVSFHANLLLIDQFNLTVDIRRQRLNEAVVGALSTGEHIGQVDRVAQMSKFIDSNIVFRDILVDSLRHDKDYQIAVLEMYTRKIYDKTHELVNMDCGECLRADGYDTSCWISFQFMTRYAEEHASQGATPSKPRRESVGFTELAAMARLQAATGIENDAMAAANLNVEFYNPIVPGLRHGVLAVVESMSELPYLFPLIAEKIPEGGHGSNLHVNAIHVVILSGAESTKADDEISNELATYLSTQLEQLNRRFVRRVTFFVGKIDDGKTRMPALFTFRSRTGFREDRLYRHIEAPHAFHLDLLRLSNFSINLEEGVQTYSGDIHLYRAVPKTGRGARRYFARLVSFPTDVHNNDFESLFVEALDRLSLVLAKEDTQDKNGRTKNVAANHIFVNVVSPDSVIQPDVYDTLLRNISTKYWYKVMRLNVTTVELKLICRTAMDSQPMFIRIVASNPTGFALQIDKYYEVLEDKKTVFKSLTKHKGPWEGLSTQTPYETSQKFENQRAEALASSDTLYAYDWPTLFASATYKQWQDFHRERRTSAEEIPENYFSCQELVMSDFDTKQPFGKGWTAKDAENRGILVPSSRDAGLNDVGMVAWLMTLRTPECPDGREIVVICNDITFQAGSFGTREDVFFFKASEYARSKGVPRLFLTANSGARIGMAQSLKNKFQVCWMDERDPTKGFKYIYMTKADYEAQLTKVGGDITALPVIVEELEMPNEENRFVITDIIGEEPDLGVENLMGSGLIAGETSRAYDEIFTLTLVVGRTVGIGAYLVRLGQRTIQKTRNAPIILTGYQALNKLMGQEIYTTNDQLGGPMIMFPNGVSHLLAETHYDTVLRALEWLTYVPAVKGGPLPVRNIEGVDSVSRLVQFAPQKGLTYDPRLLLDGVKLTKDDSSWKSGFFDKNSFVEMLSGWAKTVVVGRGRLGGIPMGVIVTENRTSEATKPADPADRTSQEKLVQQAGGVWFPDSAYKTAQALKDFNREGLPCIIFANWRGFSGGQRDMFDEVLKFGSMIVDALVAYQQPLFVYIPPFAELRGGAWVVVDSTINSDVMEFYAAEDARGGVLEAAGAASIKFRDRDIIETAHRLDATLIDLDQRLVGAQGNAALEIQKQIKHRERMLMGIYQQIAVHFADLHDTPGRMKSKGVIRRQVQWAESRKFFYWRLRRRLREFEIANGLINGTKSVIGQRKKITFELQRWFFDHVDHNRKLWDNDESMVDWYSSHEEEVRHFIAHFKNSTVVAEITSKLHEALECAAIESNGESEQVLREAFSTLSKEDRAAILKALN